MSDDPRNKTRQRMKAILQARKAKLDLIKEGDNVRARYNGEIWDALVVKVTSRKFTYPDFHLRFEGSRTLYCTGGSQIVLPGEE